MNGWKAPAGLSKAVQAAMSAGRSFLVSHGEDTGGSPFVALTVKWDDAEVRLTWHTRGTGTYRLFSALARNGGGWRDVTLTGALALVNGAEQIRKTA